jgi:hypothetical protein
MTNTLILITTILAVSIVFLGVQITAKIIHKWLIGGTAALPFIGGATILFNFIQNRKEVKP